MVGTSGQSLYSSLSKGREILVVGRRNLGQEIICCYEDYPSVGVETFTLSALVDELERVGQAITYCYEDSPSVGVEPDIYKYLEWGATTTAQVFDAFKYLPWKGGAYSPPRFI